MTSLPDQPGGDEIRSLRQRFIQLDKTAKQLHEEQVRLKNTLHQLDTILNGMLIGCQVLDRQLVYRYLNDTACAHTRKPRSELIGASMTDCYPGIVNTELFSRIRMTLQENRPVRFENEFLYEDGMESWYEIFTVPMADGIMILSLDVSDRKRETVEHKRLAAILESSRDAVLEQSLDGIILTWNRGAQEIYGYSEEEVIGQSMRMLWPARFQSEVDDILANMRRGEEISLLETDHLRKTGDRFQVSISVSLIRDAHGRVTGVCTIARDISDLYHAEKDLRDSEEKIRLLFEQASDAIIRASFPDGRILEANGAALALLKYSHKKLLTLSMDDIVTRETLVQSAYDQIRRQSTTSIIESEAEWLRSDKVAIPVSVRAKLIEYSNRKEIQLIGRDITRAQQSREELSRSEERFRSTFDQAAVGICHTSAKGRFLLLNQRFCDIVGRTYDQMIHLSFADITHPDDIEHDREAALKLINGEVGSYQAEKRYLKPDSSVVWCQLTSSLLKSSEEPEPCFLTIVQDITEKKELAARFEQQSRMEALSRFAGGISHDFNNILTLISGHIDLLMLNDKVNPTIRKDLESISQTVDRATSLTHQLLQFSNVRPLAAGKIDINKLVLSLEKQIRQTIHENTQLDIQLSEETVLVRIDPVQFEQILLNLCSNAGEAMPKGGKLTIESSLVNVPYSPATSAKPGQDKPYLSLVITNTGKGYTVDALNHLFEPYLATKEIGRGTGFGLAMVYGIVQQAGGHISVHSEAKKGTSFKIYLPTEQGNVETVQKPFVPEVIAGGSESILLIEDNDQLRALTRKILSSSGYLVFDAPSGDDALRVFRENSKTIQLVIADIILPGKNGIEVVRELRTTKPDLKCLLISGYTTDKLPYKFEQDSATRFLEKPYRSSQLISVVRALLDSALHDN